MGRKNYLIEGLSGTGKTSVAEELQRRGHHAIHGDRDGIVIDATAPIERVVDEILRRCQSGD